MIAFETWLLFSLACIALAATPGPNVLYLVSRTLAQGRGAGFVSLAGTSAGLAVHVLAAAFGLSVLLATVPLAYDLVRWAGALYLAWLAWTTWRAQGEAVGGTEARVAPRARMFRDGLLTGVLNPKVALFQLALFPQFVDPARGSVLAQSLALAATQLAIVVACDSLYVLAAAHVRRWFTGRPGWGRWSRRALAGVFGALALRLAFEQRR